ncbi:MAG TPA: methyltransferase domain-containing protein [Acidimicrobiales bacterium]|nr:methyltransferase domain-containing protein [Acidimicrobiales bacterium]
MVLPAINPVARRVRSISGRVIDLFGHPAGRAARPMATVLNFFNRRSGKHAASALGVRPGHQVLEVGFGGGAAIMSTLQALAGEGQMIAVDLSLDMVTLAATRFPRNLLELVCADVTALPFENGSFDRAYALHSHMYWPSLLDGASEMHRVLAPGGRLLLGMDTVAGIPLLQRCGKGSRPAAPAEVAGLLAEAGFVDVTCQSLVRGVVGVAGVRR